MPSADLSLSSLSAQAKKTGPAWILVQEPSFVGFGVLTTDALVLPPGQSLNMDHLFDLRAFGEKGEWHLWRTGDGGWADRFLGCGPGPDDITEEHVLWGTRAEMAGPGVTLVREDQGARYLVPLSLGPDQLPLKLKIRQVVTRQVGTGLAGITDALILGLYNAKGHKVQPPLGKEWMM